MAKSKKPKRPIPQKQKTTRQSSPKKTHKKTKTRPQKQVKIAPAAWEVAIEKHGLWITLSVLVVTAFIVFKDFLLFSNLYLYTDIGSDTINIFYPAMLQVSQHLRTEGIPLWSFFHGMGQNIFPTALNDPFVWPLYLFSPDNLAYGIGYMEFFKIILIGLVFYFYLRLLGMKKYTALIGSVLMAFSGFVILGSGWYKFSTRAFQMVFLLFAFEKLFVQNRWLWFILAIFLIALFQPFNLYVFGLFLLIYSVFRSIDTGNFTLKKYGVLVGKMAGLGIIGIGLSSFVLFSRLLQIIESPRVSGGASLSERLQQTGIFALEQSQLNYGIAAHHYKTLILRLFSNDILGAGSDFKGWNNYLEAPILYIGLLPLLLAPQVFAFLKKHQKILYAIVLALFVVPMIFPYFRYAFWLFAGDYYRSFGFLFSIILLFFAIKALNIIIKEQKIHLISLIATAVVLLVLVSLPYYSDITTVSMTDDGLINTVRILIIVYALLIWLLASPKFHKAGKIALVLLVIIEAAYFSSITANDRKVLTDWQFKQKTGFNDYTVEAIDFINEHDSSAFFRVQKDYYSGPAEHSSLNDAQVQNYYSTPAYGSFNSKYYTEYLSAVDQIEEGREMQTRWITGLANRPLLQTVAGVKYNLSKDAQPRFLQFGYEQIAEFEDVKVLRNNYSLPFGFTYENYMHEADFMALTNPFQKDFMQLKAFVVHQDNMLPALDENFTALQLKDTTAYFNLDLYDSLTTELRSDTLQMTHFSQNRIEGNISLDKPKLLYIPTIYNKGWEAVVDGSEAEIYRVNFAFMGIPLQAGEHSVQLQFRPPYFTAGLWASVVSLGLLLLVTGGKYWLEKNKKS